MIRPRFGECPANPADCGYDVDRLDPDVPGDEVRDYCELGRACFAPLPTQTAATVDLEVLVAEQAQYDPEFAAELDAARERLAAESHENEGSTIIGGLKNILNRMRGRDEL